MKISKVCKLGYNSVLYYIMILQFSLIRRRSPINIGGLSVCENQYDDTVVGTYCTGENIIYIYFHYLAQYSVLDIYDVMLTSSCVATHPRNTLGSGKVGSLSCTYLDLLCL